MRSVGEILKNKRLEKGLDLSEVEGATKIKREFLQALEKNNWAKITSEVALRGFVKNYAEFLGLSSKTVLAIFKRDFVNNKHKIRIPYQPRFTWTPKLTMILLITLFALLLIAYLVRQYFSLANTPYR